MPPITDKREAARLVKRRHPEYTTQAVNAWEFLYDSLEGGSWYRDRTLATDAYGYASHYLIRHAREYPSPAELAAFGGVSGYRGRFGMFGAAAQSDPGDKFEMRRARTPVPDFVQEVVHKHLSRIYAREVRREGNPPEYEAWSADVDGKGTSVDRWIRHEVAPLLYTLGTLDVLCDHPAPPDGETIATDADRRRLGLSSVVARLVQPVDVLWWRLKPDGSYREVLNREWHDDEDGTRRVERFRHWTERDWSLYDADGELLDSDSHPFARVPQVRLRIGTKHRCEGVGATPLERAAQIQREYYNRDSELILSDTIQAHPTLQGPPREPTDPQAGDSVAVGAGWMLEKVYVPQTQSLEGYEAVDFPKGGAESIRANLAKLRDELDRTYALNKPAGASATGGSGSGTVAQSGVSKSYDAATLNDILGELSDTLADAETHVGRLVMVVATDGRWAESPDGSSSISIVYPKQFDLFTADELAERWLACLELAREGRDAPETTRWVVGAIVRDHLIPGRSDADYETTDAEIQAVMAAAEANAEAMAGLAGGDADGEQSGTTTTETNDDDPTADEPDPE